MAVTQAQTTRRRWPRWSELRPMLSLRPTAASREHRVANGAHSVTDLRAIAARTVPRSVFDYVDGGAENEVGITASRAAFDAVRFAPRVLRSVDTVSTATQLWDTTLSMPLILAPTGFTRLAHHHGEVAVARAAGAAGVPYVLSVMGTSSIEQVAQAAPQTQRWFQLYVWRDRNLSERLMARAAAAGCPVLVVTVDVPTGGARLRDLHNGFTMPPTITPSVALNMARHPRWLTNMLTSEPLAFASMEENPGGGVGVAEVMARMFDPTVSFEDLNWIRRHWPHKLVVKGLTSPDDARRAVDLGADGVVVSDHGGRQLDRTATPLLRLPRIAEAVGRSAVVMLDGGVRTGADLVAARAYGADAVLIGRAYLYGLMAAGRPGVDRALHLIRADVERTLRLLGLTDVADVDRSALAEDQCGGAPFYSKSQEDR